MYRRIALVVVACIALALPAGALAAKKKKSHKLNVTVAAAVVGGQSGNTLIVGTLSGSLKGAVVYSAKSAGGSNLTVPFTAFTTKGTLKGNGTVTFTQNPDTSFTYTGTGKISSGTGTYKGAKGTFTVTGSEAANDTVIHLTLKGSVKY